jgi:YidC/Oxa1 family membrane protein insertase
MNNSNFMLAALLSVAIFVGFHFFYEKPRMERLQAAQIAQQALEKSAAVPTQTASAAPVNVGQLSRTDRIKETTRVAIASATLNGSINLTGARLDDLTLPQYRETVDPHSPPIVLLSPSGSAMPHQGYYAEFGWLSDTPLTLPDAQSVWSNAAAAALSPQQPVTLRWDNGHGLRLERVIALDDQYMFTLTDKVSNDGDAPITLHPYALVAHQGKSDKVDMAMGHVGPMGVFNGVLREHGYDAMMEQPETVEASTGGWLGIGDKYWLVALIPGAQEALNANFKYAALAGHKPEYGQFQADYRGAPITVAAKASVEYSRRFFAGAKHVELLDDYADKYHIENFTLAIDFGWFRFLTKPMLYTLNWLGNHLGNMGWAILALTVLVKLLVLPLGIHSFRSMAKMKQLQPEMQRINERYKSDPQRRGVETMELFRREKTSPVSGCIPILAQLPFFFALYKILSIDIDIYHAPFFGWIRDLSAPDPTSYINLFGLLPWDPPSGGLGLFHIGVTPILMGVSMFLLQRMSPKPPDPTQAQVIMFMPLIFTIMIAPSMASGLIIYWTWSNLISIAQQYLIFRRMGVKTT